MRHLGVSIYPDKSDSQTIKDYLKKASKYGFSRIFTCLLSVNKPKDELIAEFVDLHQYAHDLGFTIVADVAPRVFEDLGLMPGDLGFFKQLGVDTVRLDRGFTGMEEALMTYNEEGLAIEINMSNDVSTIDTIMDYQPNPYRLWGCHNFYPHDHTGLDLAFFQRCTQRFKQYGLKTAAFVTSQQPNTFGPWPVSNGLPTLEMHRHWPIDLQARHLIALGGIDDIIISNCYASEQELASLGQLNLEMLNLTIHPEPGLEDILREIVFDTIHMNRGDITPCMIRSSRPRETFAGRFIPLTHSQTKIKRGDVLVESSEAANYAAECQIALVDFESDGKSNVVGHIEPQQLFLLESLRPWQKFKLCPPALFTE